MQTCLKPVRGVWLRTIANLCCNLLKAVGDRKIPVLFGNFRRLWSRKFPRLLVWQYVLPRFKEVNG